MLIGIEIGGTKLQVVVGRSPTETVARRRMDVDPQRGAERIRAQVASAVCDVREAAPAPCRAVGVGFGGPIDVETGVIALSNQVSGWAGFGLSEWLHELTGLPVAVENDANAAALAEARAGAGRCYRRVFYVTLGSGVGGGMVIDGELYHGAPPGESEIGLMALDPEGHAVESRCSGWAVDAKIREHVLLHPEGLLARLVHESGPPEARQLRQAIEGGDPHAGAILEEWSRDMGLALSHVAHLFHPEVVVLGGGLALVGEPLRRAAAETLRDLLHPAYVPGPEVALNHLGEDVVCVGAMMLAQRAASPGLPLEGQCQ